MAGICGCHCFDLGRNMMNDEGRGIKSSQVYLHQWMRFATGQKVANSAIKRHGGGMILSIKSKIFRNM